MPRSGRVAVTTVVAVAGLVTLTVTPVWGPAALSGLLDARTTGASSDSAATDEATADVAALGSAASAEKAARAQLDSLPAAPASIVKKIRKSVPEDEPAKGLVYTGLEVAVDDSCDTDYVTVDEGNCSHGPDLPIDGVDVADREPVQPITAAAVAATGSAAATTAAAAATVPCYGTGSDGNRVQVLYVYSGSNRFSTYETSFQAWAAGVDTIINSSAAETGGARHLRFLTEQTADGCVPTVTPVQLTSGQIADMNAMESALVSLGYGRKDRKYITFADTSVYCGIGNLPGDSVKSDSNWANFGPSFARVDNGCWASWAAAHEFGHNIGAVQFDAPNTSNGGHCVDEWDLMCYSDEPYYPAMVTRCPDRAHDTLFDCNHDDYFNTNPGAGSYLATHYNSADNLFLSADAGTTATPTPTPTTATPTPTPTTATPTPTPTTTTVTPTPTPTTTTATPTPTPTTTTATPTPTPTTATPTPTPTTATPTPTPTTATPTPTPTATPIPGTFGLRNYNSGLCLSVRDNLIGSKLSFTQLPCDASAPAQRFVVSKGRLMLGSTGKCVAIRGQNPDAGARVITMPCSTTDVSQKIWAAGKFVGFRFSGMCLDVKGSSTKVGAVFIQNTCDASRSQQYKLV